MLDRHAQEKKQFRQLFEQQGLDRFEERFQVLESFLKLEHHVSLDEIIEQLKTDGAQVDRSFLSQCMEQLCRFGFASRVEFDQDEKILYEHRHLGVHHDHMVCTKCGSILEFKDEALEALQEKVARDYGFYMLQHKMEIYGLCSSCRASRDDLVPLNKAKTGEKLVVKDVDAGKKMQMRISAMGLNIGDTIEMVSSSVGGQVVIAVGQNRLVLGAGMSQKIWVKTKESSQTDRFDSPSLPDKRFYTDALPLSRMQSGQEGQIVKVTGESVLRRRLLEMGINRGTTVYVVKYAPLKDPIELMVKGYHISLRVEEAANILVSNIRSKKR